MKDSQISRALSSMGLHCSKIPADQTTISLEDLLDEPFARELIRGTTEKVQALDPGKHQGDKTDRLLGLMILGFFRCGMMYERFLQEQNRRIGK